MTTHPIDEQAEWGAHMSELDQLARECDELAAKVAAAEHRATRAEAQSAIRGRAVAIYQQRAREAEARIKAVEDVLDHHPYGGPGQEDAIRRALDP